jgi:phosphate transport system protein
MTQELRKTFHHQLEEIHDDVVRLAALVCETIPRGTQALLDGDLAAGEALIDHDDELDELALAVEDRCYHVLALQAPMASDMRALVTAIRLTSEIERSGDLMVNVAKASRRIHGMSIDPKVRGLIQTMSDEALRLYRLAMAAYADRDETAAAALDELDDTLDDVHRSFIAQVLESCRAGSIDIECAVQLALVGRYYERIGDHAVNIGERVRYMVSGWMPERVAAARDHIDIDSD